MHRRALQRRLDSQKMERQWVITQARKGKISDEDMDLQLGALSIQEMDLKRRLTRQIEASNLAAPTDWEAVTREYLTNLTEGLDWLNAAPQNDEERHQMFQ